MTLLRVAVATTLICAGVSSNTSSAARSEVFNGERRTYYASGALYQRLHYANGREEGLQQAWTEDGELYLNYEMRNGRRYGFVNARPCVPVQEEQP